MTVLPLDDYTVPSLSIGPVVVPENVSILTLFVRRNTPVEPFIWPDSNTILSLQSEISYDGGVQWRPFFGFIARGGVAIDDSTRQPAVSLYITVPLPRLANQNCQVQATLGIVGGPLRTAVDLEVA